MKIRNFFLFLAIFLFCGIAFAHEPEAISHESEAEEKEPVAVVELGSVNDWTIKDGVHRYGANAAIEVTPIEHWLKVEAGVIPLFQRHHATEWNTELLFKKPWTLSNKVEFLVGAGPVWVHASEPDERRNSLAGKALVDLMVWTSAQHRIGWYLEPGFDYNFAAVHNRSAGFTSGLLIGIPSFSHKKQAGSISGRE